MELKSKIWMTGALEWYAMVGGEEVFLGQREVPFPLEEGDGWTNQLGVSFRVESGEIVIVGKGAPPERAW